MAYLYCKNHDTHFLWTPSSPGWCQGCKDSSQENQDRLAESAAAEPQLTETPKKTDVG
jgi:hypothetical protein